MQNTNGWIKSLKVGDEVIIHTNFDDSIGIVTAVNKTTVKVGNSLYDKESGWLKGCTQWNLNQIIKATAEAREKGRMDNMRRALARRIYAFPFNSCTAEEIMKYHAFLDKLEEDRKKEE